MYFEIVGVVEAVESIATGSGVRQIDPPGGVRRPALEQDEGDCHGSRRGLRFDVPRSTGMKRMGSAESG